VCVCVFVCVCVWRREFDDSDINYIYHIQLGDLCQISTMHLRRPTITPEHTECPGNIYEGCSARVRISCSKHPCIAVVTQDHCTVCVCVYVCVCIEEGGGGGGEKGG